MRTIIENTKFRAIRSPPKFPGSSWFHAQASPTNQGPEQNRTHRPRAPKPYNPRRFFKIHENRSLWPNPLDAKISVVIAARRLRLGHNLDTTDVDISKIPNRKSSIRFLEKIWFRGRFGNFQVSWPNPLGPGTLGTYPPILRTIAGGVRPGTSTPKPAAATRREHCGGVCAAVRGA